MLLKKPKQQPKPVEVPTSLAERLTQARAEAEAFIEAKVQELKAAPDGASLPLDWLRYNLRADHGGAGAGCNCRVALSLLEDKQ